MEDELVTDELLQEAAKALYEKAQMASGPFSVAWEDASTNVHGLFILYASAALAAVAPSLIERGRADAAAEIDRLKLAVTDLSIQLSESAAYRRGRAEGMDAALEAARAALNHDSYANGARRDFALVEHAIKRARADALAAKGET
jgi:hypothetical protein